jgi:hypothetical protein
MACIATLEAENRRLKALVREAIEFEDMQYAYAHQPIQMVWLQKAKEVLKDEK